MHRAVRMLDFTCDYMYTRFTKHLCLATKRQLFEKMMTICDELFGHDAFTYVKLVSLFLFGAHLGRHMFQTDKTRVADIAIYLGNYIKDSGGNNPAIHFPWTNRGERKCWVIL